jgi:hypothetical protein
MLAADTIHSNNARSFGPTEESAALAAQLNEPKFGYLSKKDRLLLLRR